MNPTPSVTEDEFDEAGFNKAGRPLCVFCSAPWGDNAVRLFELDAGDHCDSGRFYAECCTVNIFCDACGREVYRKEGKTFE